MSEEEECDADWDKLPVRVYKPCRALAEVNDIESHVDHDKVEQVNAKIGVRAVGLA